MARTPKPSGSKRTSGPRTRSKRRTRPDKKIRYLVVTEGARTESAYFEQVQLYFPEQCQAQLIVRPDVRARNAHWDPSPVAVVRKCIELKDQDEQKHNNDPDADVGTYAACFVVIDVDHRNTVSSSTGISQLHEAINLAKSNNIHVVITNPKTARLKVGG